MRAALCLGLLLTPLSALADGSPTTGVFTWGGHEERAGDEQRRCAFYLTVIDKYDVARDYVLNLNRYRYQTTGKISFVPVDLAQCSYVAQTHTEDCQLSHQAYADSRTSYFTTIESVTPDRVVYYVYDTRAARLKAAVVKHRPDDPARQEAARCVGLNERSIAPYLAKSVQPLTQDDVAFLMGDLQSGPDGNQYRDIAEMVLSKLK